MARVEAWVVAGVVLFLAGCAPHLAVNNPVTFRTNSDDAKVYVYTLYDDPNDVPYFDDVFRIHADQGYIGDIVKTQYADTTLAPGSHVITVDQINWAGNTVSKAKLTVLVQPKTPLYIEDHVLSSARAPDKPEKRAVLLSVGSARGDGQVEARKRACLCDQLWFGL